jgi:methionyl-tRNA formyltransferase
MGPRHDRVVFAGSIHEAEPALRALLAGPSEISAVVTQPRSRAAELCGFIDLAPLARQHGVPVVYTTDINEPSTVERIRACKPDLLVVIGWSRLIRPELLSLPPRGCVGCHASLLPAHRGRAPVNWSIIRGETGTGNTLILLAAGADTGDIVDQRPIPIGPDDTCATVYAKVGAAGANMLRTHMSALLAGTVPRRPQHGQGDVLPKRTPAMGVTDWSRPARAIHDWIRGQTRPYPGAFTRFHGEQLMLWRSRWLADGGRPATLAPPGTVIQVAPDGMTVATGDGPLTVTEISRPGQPEQPVTTCCRDMGIGPGARFDPVDPATTSWALGLGPRPMAEVRAS